MSTSLDHPVDRKWYGSFLRRRASFLSALVIISLFISPVGPDVTAQEANPASIALAESVIARQGEENWSHWRAADRSLSGSRARVGSSIGLIGTSAGLSLLIPLDSLTTVHAQLHGVTVASYRETDASVGISRQIGSLSGSVSLHLNAVAIEQYGSSLAPTLDVALQMPLTPEVTFGAVATNVSGSRHADQPLPYTLGVGLAIRPDSALTLSIDALSESIGPLSLRTGLTWDAIELLRFRFGLGTAPSRVGLGLGLRIGSYDIDIASEYRPGLGLRHAFGGGVRW